MYYLQQLSSSKAVSSNFDNAVRLYRSLLYSIFHFYIIPFEACVVNAQPYLHPCGYLTRTHTTDNMQQTRCTVYEYCLQVSWHTSSVLHYVNFATKQQHRQQCCSPSYHTTHCAHCKLQIACMTHTMQRTIFGDVTAELANANNLRLRYSSGEEKIEDWNRDVGDLD